MPVGLSYSVVYQCTTPSPRPRAMVGVSGVRQEGWEEIRHVDVTYEEWRETKGHTNDHQRGRENTRHTNGYQEWRENEEHGNGSQKWRENGEHAGGSLKGRETRGQGVSGFRLSLSPSRASRSSSKFGSNTSRSNNRQEEEEQVVKEDKPRILVLDASHLKVCLFVHIIIIFITIVVK